MSIPPNNNFYLTSLPKENKSDLSQGQNSHYLIKNEMMFQKTTSDFLDFMVNSETQYTDLTKIQDYFKQQLIKYGNVSDLNKDLINKKTKELNDIQMQIEQEILKEIKIDTNSINKMYDERFEQLKKLIEKQEHSLETYKSTHAVLYEENYKLKKKVNDNIKSLVENNEQFSSYEVIKNTSEREFKLQKNLLNSMQDFKEKNDNYYDLVLNKKKKIYTKFEYDVSKIKSKAIEAMSEYENVKAEIIKTENLIEEQKLKNTKLMSEYKQANSYYYSTTMKLNDIYHKLKVDDIDSIISKFKNVLIQYHGSSSIYNNLLHEITRLNVEHTKLNGVLAELRKKIKEHNDFLQEDDVEVVGKFKLEKERNKILTVKIREKENLLREIFNFLLKYEKKMTDIVLSLTISNLKFTSRSNRRFEEIGLTNKDKSMSFLNKLSCMPTWEQNEFKEFLQYFLKFLRKINFVYINFIIHIAVHFYRDREIRDEFVFGIKSEEIQEKVDEVIGRELKVYEDKLNLRDRSIKEILKDKKSGELSKDFAFSKKSTLNEIINHYYDHIQQISLESKDSVEKLVEALSEKFFNQISKYTNDFVEIPTKVGLNYLHTQGDSSGQNKTDKDGKEIKEAKEKGQASSSNLALETKRSKENGTLKMVASTSKMTVPVNVNVNVNVESLDNSYHSNKEVKIHVDKSKKERNYFGYKEQKRNELMGTYNRLNDLRKLQLNLFKTSKNSKIKPQDFSEIYYNFRKKFHSKGFEKEFSMSRNLMTEQSTDRSPKVNFVSRKTSFQPHEIKGREFTNHNENRSKFDKSSKAIAEIVSTTHENTKPTEGNVRFNEVRTSNNFFNSKRHKMLKELFSNSHLEDNEKEIRVQKEKLSESKVNFRPLDSRYSGRNRPNKKLKNGFPLVTDRNSILTTSYTNYYTKFFKD